MLLQIYQWTYQRVHFFDSVATKLSKLASNLSSEQKLKRNKAIGLVFQYLVLLAI